MKQFFNKINPFYWKNKDNFLDYQLPVLVIAFAIIGVGIWLTSAYFQEKKIYDEQQLSGLVVNNFQVIDGAVASIFSEALHEQFTKAGAIFNKDEVNAVAVIGIVKKAGGGHSISVTVLSDGKTMILESIDADPDGTDDIKTNAQHVVSGITSQLAKWHQQNKQKEFL